MSSETLKFKGMLGDLEQDAKALEIRIDGIVLAMRDNLNPMTSARRLAVEIISAQAFDLEARQSEYLEILAKIEKAKDLLGR